MEEKKVKNNKKTEDTKKKDKKPADKKPVDKKPVDKKLEQSAPSAENSELEFVTLANDKGDVFELLIVDDIEIEDVKYYIVVEAKDANNEACEYEIIKEIEENGEPMLVSVDDEEEFNMVADCYDEIVASEIDYDAQY